MAIKENRVIFSFRLSVFRKNNTVILREKLSHFISSTSIKRSTFLNIKILPFYVIRYFAKFITEWTLFQHFHFFPDFFSSYCLNIPCHCLAKSCLLAVNFNFKIAFFLQFKHIRIH